NRWCAPIGARFCIRERSMTTISSRAIATCVLATLALPMGAAAQAHPSVFLSAADAAAIRTSAAKYPMLTTALRNAKQTMATALAYDCVYDWLKPAERRRFEANVFRPMADWLSVNQAKEFDRIHNHGTWATAAVGTLGYVIRDTSYVNRALYGTKRDKSGGFLRQLDLLFSPDGYYMEGPYYVRYAILPFYQ